MNALIPITSNTIPIIVFRFKMFSNIKIPKTISTIAHTLFVMSFFAINISFLNEFIFLLLMNDDKGAEIIECKPYDDIKDWVQDETGYFTIKPFKDEGVIKVRFYTNDHKRKFEFSGKTPQDLYFEITQRKLISRFDHAAYLGKELEKAFLALKYDLEYVQDDLLKL